MPAFDRVTPLQLSGLLKYSMHCLVQKSKPQSCNGKCNPMFMRLYTFTTLQCSEVKTVNYRKALSYEKLQAPIKHIIRCKHQETDVKWNKTKCRQQITNKTSTFIVWLLDLTNVLQMSLKSLETTGLFLCSRQLQFPTPIQITLGIIKHHF